MRGCDEYLAWLRALKTNRQSGGGNARSDGDAAELIRARYHSTWSDRDPDRLVADLQDLARRAAQDADRPSGRCLRNTATEIGAAALALLLHLDRTGTPLLPTDPPLDETHSSRYDRSCDQDDADG